MTIFIIGQSSVHWGRVEFGNIGNYYILEPAVRGLHQTFANLQLLTTLQLSDRFQQEEKIKSLPLDLYYGFKKDDLKIAEEEYHLALEYNKTGKLHKITPFMEVVLKSDLIIDFSGDIWGDNADFLGENRFLVGLYKSRTAQLLGIKTAMIAGSPGPFNTQKNLDFTREVFENFDLVTNRETYSRKILEQLDFNLAKLKDLSCPSFLFEAEKDLELKRIHPELSDSRKNQVVGVIICGWNFPSHSFDTSKRTDAEYDFMVLPLVEFLKQNKEVKLCLMSHSNGFNPDEKPFRLLHGRDYENIKQLEQILIQKGFGESVFSLNEVYEPKTTKAIIGGFDMLISGRIHGAVAGFSQAVPTVVIDYGNGPEAHKLKGFAKEVDMLSFVANPNKPNDILEKIELCYQNLEEIKKQLQEILPGVKARAKQNFSLLKEIVK